jgi:hypothetical protein
VSPRAVLDAVVKRKISSSCLESNPRTPIVQPVAQRYTTELSRLLETREASLIPLGDPFEHETGSTCCPRGTIFRYGVMTPSDRTTERSWMNACTESSGRAHCHSQQVVSPEKHDSHCPT